MIHYIQGKCDITFKVNVMWCIYFFSLSFQFTDKLENMLENLTVTAEQVKNAEPISAHPDKLRDQIDENKVDNFIFFLFQKSKKLL